MFYYVALAALDLDQVGLELTEIHLPLHSSAEIKDFFKIKKLFICLYAYVCTTCVPYCSWRPAGDISSHGL